VLFAFVAVWAVRLRTGVRFRPVWLGFSVLVYLAAFSLFETGRWYGLTTAAPVELLVLFVTLVATAIWTVRTTGVRRHPSGYWEYIASPMLAVMWLAILILEIYVQEALLGHVTVGSIVTITGFPGSGILPVHQWFPGTATLVLAVLEMLFAVGTGIAVGHIFGVYGAYLTKRQRPSSYPRGRPGAPGMPEGEPSGA
jgi:hypothetical protein